jgi:hypothetical protein
MNLRDRLRLLTLRGTVQRFDLRARLLPGLPQVIGGLHVEPDFRAGVQPLREAQGHIGADGGLAVQHARQRRARHSQRLGRFGDRDTSIGEDAVFQNFTRMRGIMHFAHGLLSLSRYSRRGITPPKAAVIACYL